MWFFMEFLNISYYIYLANSQYCKTQMELLPVLFTSTVIIHNSEDFFIISKWLVCMNFLAVFFFIFFLFIVPCPAEGTYCRKKCPRAGVVYLSNKRVLSYSILLQLRLWLSTLFHDCYVWNNAIFLVVSAWPGRNMASFKNLLKGSYWISAIACIGGVEARMLSMPRIA